LLMLNGWADNVAREYEIRLFNIVQSCKFNT
jgi:hypothetical protein